MYHFFIERNAIDKETVTITGKDVNHIKNVLRMKKGEEFTVSVKESAGEYKCALREYTDDSVICDILSLNETGNELPSKIYLFQGLPKSDKMELIIQKAVELGAFKIIPVEMKRSVMKLDSRKAPDKIKRWQAISEAAAKQSKRSIIPEISMPVSFKEALSEASSLTHKLVPYECAEGIAHTKEVMNKINPGDSVAIFIGPEGGFDEGEIELAKSSGFEIITLGKRILRTETAGMVVLSILMMKLDEDPLSHLR